jgi:hypothetical protein
MAECKVMPATLLEMLASTIMTDDAGDTYFNVICFTGTGLESAFTCDLQGQDLEQFIVNNGFGTDSNGKPAIKLNICTVEA